MYKDVTLSVFEIEFLKNSLRVVKYFLSRNIDELNTTLDEIQLQGGREACMQCCDKILSQLEKS